MPDINSFLLRQIFNDAAYFYELRARQGLEKGTSAAYPRGKPFNQLSFTEAWAVWTKVEKVNRAGLHIAPLRWADELARSLPGTQVLLQVGLEGHKDGHSLSQFKKQLQRMRAELKIPQPARSASKSNRILNTGRSFRPIEALDVHRLSGDDGLRRYYSDQVTEANLTKCGT